MISEFQIELIGKCKFCKGKILWNEDEGKSIFNPQEPGCYCELEKEIKE